MEPNQHTMSASRLAELAVSLARPQLGTFGAAHYRESLFRDGLPGETIQTQGWWLA